MKKIKLVGIILMAPVLSYLVLGVYIFLHQRSFIYYPDKQDFNSCAAFADAQKINLNGTRAYFKNVSKNVVVFYHGNAGSACQRSYLAKFFEELNFSYLIVEYTGYSNDDNKSSKTALFKNVDDVNSFIGSQDFDGVYVVGESLGTALASYNASLNNKYKLLLVSPFYKLADIAQLSFPFYPISWILQDKYDNSDFINKLNYVTIIHGDSDRTIPISESKKLFQNIKSNNKFFITIPGGGHNGLYNIPLVQSSIINFLGQP